MPLGRYKTASEILNDVALDLGLGTATDPMTSTETHFKQLRNALRSAGQALAEDFEWRHLTVEAILTKSGGTWTLPTGWSDATGDVLNLPADWVGLAPRTGWDRTNGNPLGGPMDGEIWQCQRAGPGPLVYANFRLDTNQIRFLPVPLGDRTIALEYYSRSWVRPAANGLGTGNTLGPAGWDEPAAAADVVLFDRRLITALTKLYWKRERGFDTASAEQEATRAMSAIFGKQTAAPVLDLSKTISGPTLLSSYNIPNIIPT